MTAQMRFTAKDELMFRRLMLAARARNLAAFKRWAREHPATADLSDPEQRRVVAQQIVRDAMEPVCVTADREARRFWSEKKRRIAAARRIVVEAMRDG